MTQPQPSSPNGGERSAHRLRREVGRILMKEWGTLPGGRVVHQYSLVNTHGTTVTAITLGATLTSIVTPDADGNPGDIILGHDQLEGYLTASPYLGAVVGRYANRIGNACFTLDGTTYQLARNQGQHALHGGVVGFDKAVWEAQPVQTAGGVGVSMSHRSPDGDEGYPGTLDVVVTYTLTDDDRLEVEFRAACDRATPVNLTQHAYFNLSADFRRDIGGHVLQVNASRFTAVDRDLIPTGELFPVDATPFDFRTATPIGARIDANDVQLRYGHGYDHNLVLDGTGLRRVVSLGEPVSGRVMEVWTTEPGLQLYTGNYLDGSIRGKGGIPYGRRCALCLETQHFPDSPNHPSFPGTILRPGEIRVSKTVFVFGAESRRGRTS